METKSIQLHPLIEIYADIEAKIKIQRRIEPIKLGYNSVRPEKAELIEEQKATFFLQTISIKDDILTIKDTDSIYLIDLINGFASNTLDIDKTYGFSYKNGGGFSAKIVQKDKKFFLSLRSKDDEQIYLEKLDCKAIVNRFNKLYSKCTPYDLDIDQWQELDQ